MKKKSKLWMKLLLILLLLLLLCIICSHYFPNPFLLRIPHIILSLILFALIIYIPVGIIRWLDNKFVKGEIRSRRPKGVTILAYLFLLGSLLNIPTILTFKNRLMSYQAAPFAFSESYYYVLISRLTIGLFVGLIAGIGLLKLLRWARSFSIITTVVFYIYFIISHFLYTRPYVIPYFIQENKPVFTMYIFCAISFLWTAIIIYYLTRPKVKAQFEHPLPKLE